MKLRDESFEVFIGDTLLIEESAQPLAFADKLKAVTTVS